MKSEATTAIVDGGQQAGDTLPMRTDTTVDITAYRSLAEYRPLLTELGCPAGRPDRMSTIRFEWDRDPMSSRIAIGWMVPGHPRMARGIAYAKGIETRYAAYELAEGEVLVIEAAFGPEIWEMTATICSCDGAAHDLLLGWLDQARFVGLGVQLTIDTCDFLAA
jgi:hypothetical protein